MLLLCDKMSNSRSTIASLRWPHNIHRVRACDERQRRMQIRQIRLLRKAERDLSDGIFYEIHWRSRLEEIAQYCDLIAHGKNDFADLKFLLNTDLKIILLDRQNNFGTLKIISNVAKNFNILATSLNVLHNYFDSSTKLLFWSISS